jgi:ubiquinone/menaquinone biosynthesis C-methylase UbiE
MEERYIHGDSGAEQDRLSRLNTLTNESFIAFLGVEDGFEVCDLGCGIGNLMIDIALAYPSARITGVEISERQYASAVENIEEHDGIRVVNRDLFDNGLPDNHFDITYCRYVLEHLSDPVGAVREMSRVTKPGGLIISQENDLHNVLYYPYIEGMDTVMKGFCRLQEILGGDPYVGRKLFDMYCRASLEQIQVSYEPEIHTESGPEDYRAWMENALAILVGARSDLVDRGLVGPGVIERVCHTIKMRIQRPAGVALFHWNRIKARKPLR